MRDIKFRAWDKEAKKFWLWEDLKTKIANFFELEFLDVQQFTGLKDKNGVEIYEGDIIGFPRVGDEPEVCGFVEFDKDMGNMIVNKTNGGWDYIGNYQIEIKVFEVIGNIYKNKELLSWK